MNKLEKFINEMKLVQEKLNTLENEYAEMYKEFSRNEFDSQNACITEIENFTLFLTHELSTQIAFGTFHLQQLIQYIRFRKLYQEYSDKELQSIIDNDYLNIEEKRKIINDKTDQNLMKIKSEWNTIFKNVEYKKITENLSIKTLHNK